MGLLDFIFGKTVKIEHPFFGSMVFAGSKKNPDKSYFECKRHFKPAESTIDVHVDADIEGPTEKQVAFFKSIESNYTEISASIIPLIEDQFQNWKEDFKIAVFTKEFEPVFLSIPRCDIQPIVWEIAFGSDHDRNHTFTMTMENFKATSVLIDG